MNVTKVIVVKKRLQSAHEYSNLLVCYFNFMHIIYVCEYLTEWKAANCLLEIYICIKKPVIEGSDPQSYA